MATQSKEAPGDLAAVRAFVNTLDIDHGKEELGDPAAARRLARGSRTARGGRRARRPPICGGPTWLREALRELLLSNNDGRPVPADAARVLDDVAARARLRLRVDADGSARLEAEGTRRRRRPRPPARDRLPLDGDRHVVAPQGLPRRHLQVGLLRPLQEPLRPLVLDGGLRQPPQGAPVPRAPQVRLTARPIRPASAATTAAVDGFAPVQRRRLRPWAVPPSDSRLRPRRPVALYGRAPAARAPGSRLRAVRGVRSPRLSRPVPSILVANHPSAVDPILVALPFRRPIRFMANAVQFERPFVGWCMRRLRAFPSTGRAVRSRACARRSSCCVAVRWSRCSPRAMSILGRRAAS